MMVPRILSYGAIALACAVPVVAAQAPRPLAAVAGTFADPFTTVTSVRELADGRVLVADARERKLQIVDFTRGTASMVSREGDGPGEYRVPGQLFGWLGDSIAMYDASASRILVLSSDGRPARSFQIDQYLAFATERPRGGAVRFIDRAGRVYTQSNALPVVLGDAAGPDSGPVLRYHPARSRVDTIARVKLSGLVSRRGPDGSVGANFGALANPFRVQDTWVAVPDGRIAIARSVPYSIEWISPMGERQRGPAVSHVPLRVTQQDREAVAREGVSVGGRSMPVAIGLLTDLPETKPAFDHRTIVADPAGGVWIQRFRAAGDSVPVYDVFDAAGVLKERIRIAARSRIVAITTDHVYVVRADEDDLEYLARYRR